MAIKELKTRIQLKYDSYANWTDESKGANLVLLKGEIGICEIPTGNNNATTAPTALFKVGDGETPFKSLKWASALAADVYNWAKASDVAVDGKTIKFVGGTVDAEGNKVDKVITLNFATPEEVEAKVAIERARIAALEAKFTGTGSVQGQLDALDGRLDVIEGEAAGSIKKAEADAKAYADQKDAALKTELEGYADQAEADAIAAAESKVSVERARIAALEGAVGVINGEAAGSIKKAVADAVTEVKAYADTAEADAVTTAKGYTDERETAIKTAYEAYADQAEADAKSYVNGEVTKLNAKDAAQQTAIEANATAIANEKTAREQADTAINNKLTGITGTVTDAIATAKQEAINAAATTAQGKVDALANGAVADAANQANLNAAAIAAMDDAYKAAVSNEATARENADNALDARLDKVETFFALEDGETLDTALDTLVEIQDYLNGDGSATGGMISRLSQAETDIDNLEKEFNTDNGRVKVVEGKVAGLEAKAAALEDADTTLGGRIDALVGDNGTIATGDAATLASAKAYTNERETAITGAYQTYADQAETDAVNTAKGYTDTEITKAVNLLNAKDEELAGNISDNATNVATLQDIVNGYTGKASIKAAVDAAQTQADKGVADAKKAQDAADKAQEEVDALETVVEGVKSTANLAEANLAALTGRVGTAESDIDALEAIVKTGDDTNAKLRAAITDLQTLTGTNGAIRSEIAAAKKAGDDAAAAVDTLAKGQVATNTSEIGKVAARVAAIEGDYLQAADEFIFNCGTSTTVVHKAN